MNQDTIDNTYKIETSVKEVKELSVDIKKILSDSTVFEFERILPLIKKAETVISLLFDSILQGEYICCPKIKEIINSLKEEFDLSLVGSDIEYFIQTKEALEDKELVIRLKEYVFQINNIFDVYLLFVKEIIFLFQEEKDYIPIRSYLRYNQGNVSELFIFNISLCFMEIFLDENINNCYRIEELKKKINDIKHIPFLSSQKEKALKKADFLLFKWYKRAELNGAKNHLIVDGDESIETYEEKISGYGNEWKREVDYINHHYLENKNEIVKSFRKIKNKKIESLTYREIHLYIKYYKDIEENLVKLDEIIDYLCDWKEDENISDVEKNIRFVVYNYAINNRFSLFSKNCEDKNSLFKEYEKIKGDSKNYFPQYKFIQKAIFLLQQDINKKINVLSEESNEKTKLFPTDDIEYYVKKIDNVYNKYKTNIEWSLEHTYIIFKVGFKEAFIDKIFIYSSFVLPAPNKEAKDKFDTIKNDYQILKSQIEPLNRVGSLLIKTEKINEEIKKRDVKTIELMGLFSTIIAFVMGSIPGFQFVESIWSAILFLLVFSTGLISFLLVLILITRYNGGVFKEHKGKITVFYIGVLILIVFFGWAVKFWEENEKNNEEESKQHSTVSIDIKKDSINSFEKPNKSEIKKDSVLSNTNGRR